MSGAKRSKSPDAMASKKMAAATRQIFPPNEAMLPMILAVQSGFLGGMDLKRLGSVSKDLRTAATDDKVWQDLCHKKYSFTRLDPTKAIAAKFGYRWLYWQWNAGRQEQVPGVDPLPPPSCTADDIVLFLHVSYEEKEILSTTIEGENLNTLLERKRLTIPFAPAIFLDDKKKDEYVANFRVQISMFRTSDEAMCHICDYGRHGCNSMFIAGNDVCLHHESGRIPEFAYRPTYLGDNIRLLLNGDRVVLEASFKKGLYSYVKTISIYFGHYYKNDEASGDPHYMYILTPLHLLSELVPNQMIVPKLINQEEVKRESNASEE